MQLAWTGLDGFDPSALAAAGGAGLVASAHAGQARRSARRSCPCWARRGRRPRLASRLTRSGPGCTTCSPPRSRSSCTLSPSARVPAPQPDQIGYELGDQAWQAELAWPVPRIAVIAPGPEAGDCIAAYVAAGWDARLPGDWPPDELGPRIPGGDR